MSNVSIIGSEKSGRTGLAAKLGKKGTESDITLYNFVKGDHIYSFVDANGYPGSLKSLINAVNLSDIALVCIPSSGLNSQVGECIIALDLLGNKRGLFVITMADKSNPAAIHELSEKIKAISKGTNLEKWETIAVSTTSFEGMETLKERIFKLGDEARAANSAKKDLPARVIVDHFFNVTGMGTVALGVVTQGTLRVHDSMTVFPLNRLTEIRSIQSNDVDMKSAPAGTRVGLALKTVQAKEFDRGYMISLKEDVSSKLNLKCRLTKFTSGLGVGDTVHLFAGLQVMPATVGSISIADKDVTQAPPGSDCNILLTAQNSIAYIKGDRFLIAQLNNPKQRLVAGCEVV
ncbi:MAG: elongation factor Tu [Candidatus Methanoperedens sp.]|nr:elongation factor Tu [Candidatus Methanoperedens sp.]MCE8424841.1 elongation factor Tu [Candidatus Methanoperedens sp.]MCE8428890.1 elongation factor Tu [Candidatus Methanoperedens sp.]